jgi:hypothetical protein
MKKILFFVSLIFVKQVNAQVCFTHAPSVATTGSSSERGVVSRDFNGDGKFDLAICDGYAYIALGNGNGSFGNTTTYTLSSSAQAITSADFNGDAKADLALTEPNTGKVAILFGSGTGTFGTATEYSVGSAPYQVIAADFNGDGFADVATANDDGVGTVSVLLNTGTGSFSAMTHYSSTSNNSGCLSLTSSDFNKDGKLDIASANYSGSSNNLAILLNNGNGTFAATTFYFSNNGTHTRCIFSDDFNADGNFDVGLVDDVNGNVGVLLGNGTGVFNASPILLYAGLSPFFAVTNDFNSDGKLDIAVANESSNNVSVFLGNGLANCFDTAINVSVGGANPYWLATADFNNDTKPDLAVADGNSSATYILLNCSVAGIEHYNSQADLLSTEYFNLLGQPVKEPDGVSVEVKTYVGGQREVRKVVRGN